MICPHCGSRTTTVLETRSTDETIRRRRRCAACRERFWTREAASTTGMETGVLVPGHALRDAARIAKSLAATLSDLAGL